MKHLVFLLWLMPCFCEAQEALHTQVAKANDQYEAGNYSEAVRGYESVLASGYTGASLQYNLGNAYYKSGNVSKAILHYERALQLDPAMEDAQYNLQLANQQIVDRIEPLPRLFFYRWRDAILRWMNPDGWGWIALTCAFTWSLLMGYYFLSRNGRFRKATFYMAAIALLMALATAGLGAARKHELAVQKSGIIMMSSVTVQSEPRSASKDLFILHEGSRCGILDKDKDWLKVRIVNGNEGWIQEDAMEEI